MKFKVSCELSYIVNADTTFIFNIQAARTKSQTIVEEQIALSHPKIHLESFELPFNQARCLRAQVAKTKFFAITYTAIVDVNLKPIRIKNKELQLHEIPAAETVYLFPSRYCQVDRLYQFATMEFKNAKTTLAKVQAITKWVHQKVQYVSGSTGVSTSSIETLTERQGVCRDFAHLGIALCRALSIPARYFACYAYQLQPPDFHACFEAYIDGKWILFDATQMIPTHGLVKIAHGYDAADTSFNNMYGDAQALSVSVNCELLDQPEFLRQGKKLNFICYE